MIQHILLFWFKDRVSDEDVTYVLDGIASLSEIPVVDTVAVSENRGDPHRAEPVPERVIPYLGELKTISVES
jgi:hypothetical protein